MRGKTSHHNDDIAAAVFSDPGQTLLFCNMPLKMTCNNNTLCILSDYVI